MDRLWRGSLWRQFGAAIDMLENALRACPGELWSAPLLGEHAERPELTEFWYVGYHALFWLDLYLSGSIEGFQPPPPFTLDELDPAGLLPERHYTADELLFYLEACRNKCRATIEALTDEGAESRGKVAWGEVPYLELLLDNMRHVQEHAAQLNLYLGQRLELDSRWVSQTRDIDRNE
jgi:DinB superfamily